MAEMSVRLIEKADAKVIAGLLERDAGAFARWMPDRPDGFYTVPHQEKRIAQSLTVHAGGGGWPGVIVVDGAVIGEVTVATILRGPLQKASLSYWVSSAHQGQGYASRAVESVLRVMADDLGLHRAEAHTQLDNVASHRVLRNNGFTPYGLAHNHIYIQGSWRDELFWERPLTEARPK
jgi:ribosomal-protein-alanine N-acetyltransferase